MGILSRLFSKKDESPTEWIEEAGDSLDQERMAGMFERSSSFSLVAIPGDVQSELPSFFSVLGYKPSRMGNYRGLFAELYAGIERPSGPDNSIVQKAWFEAAGHTILLDPEMVLITETERLSEMAAKVNGTVKAAIWERVSESVALVEIGPQGVVRQTWYCQGEQTDKPIDVHPEIAAQPDSGGLNKALATYGLSEEAVFGNVDATLLELQG